ncbi:hypothetical protein [uncultured Enterococcus sp.]|uniref:hypothetical protein n=1 Tax=uncultured Enterococcus sp. TaxID=167972 RepID=UPI0026108909|nr:hypothetical protein [uncultured Enterococcus sp.]
MAKKKKKKNVNKNKKHNEKELYTSKSEEVSSKSEGNINFIKRIIQERYFKVISFILTILSALFVLIDALLNYSYKQYYSALYHIPVKYFTYKQRDYDFITFNLNFIAGILIIILPLLVYKFMVKDAKDKVSKFEKILNWALFICSIALSIGATFMIVEKEFNTLLNVMNELRIFNLTSIFFRNSLFNIIGIVFSAFTLSIMFYPLIHFKREWCKNTAIFIGVITVVFHLICLFAIFGRIIINDFWNDKRGYEILRKDDNKELNSDKLIASDYDGNYIIVDCSISNDNNIIVLKDHDYSFIKKDRLNVQYYENAILRKAN